MKNKYVGWNPESKEPLPFRFADLEFNVKEMQKRGLNEQQIYEIVGQCRYDYERILNYTIWNTFNSVKQQ